MARMKGPDRVRAALEAACLKCAIRTLPASTRTAVEAAAEAHRMLEARETRGKVRLQIG